jgi:dienelactone hydrolase
MKDTAMTLTALRLLLAVFICACLQTAASALLIEDTPIRLDAARNEQIITVPSDDLHPVKLQLTLFTPKGSGPFPLAIMNHGSDGNKSAKLNPRNRSPLAVGYFLSRGYAVALPMLRGYAGSEGQLEIRGCDPATVGIDDAKDIYAIIDYLSTFSAIDSRNILVAGQSFGGWNTLALGTLKHPWVKGLINFSGGMLVDTCPNPEYSLVAAAGQFGAHTSVPSLWFYGENDKLFPVSLWRAMYERYTAEWGPAELVDYGVFKDDSHMMLGYREGLAIWVPKVDAFLAKVGLPNTPVYPEYLPISFPPPSNYAAIDNVDAVPYLNDPGRESYRIFLARPLPRAFVVAPDGTAAATDGGADPLGRALRLCRQKARDCQSYALNDFVVWTRPEDAPKKAVFAGIDDVAAVPYLNEKGRQGYQKFLTMKIPRVFVIAPNGSWSASTQGKDLVSRALKACGKSGEECRVYAVDDEVVWKQE